MGLMMTFNLLASLAVQVARALEWRRKKEESEEVVATLQAAELERRRARTRILDDLGQV